MATAPPVEHDEEAEQFVVYEPGTHKPMAYVEYSIAGGICGGARCQGVLELFHTFTDPAHRGKGLAGLVVTAAFEYCRARNLKVIPACSYVRHFGEKHPQYGAMFLAGGAEAPVREAPAGPGGAAGAPAAGGAGGVVAPAADAGAAGADVESAGGTKAQVAASEDWALELAYGQYRDELYGGHRPSAADATPPPVLPSASISVITRAATFLVRRAEALERREASTDGAAADALAARDPPSLLSEARQLLTVALARAPSAATRGGAASGTARAAAASAVPTWWNEGIDHAARVLDAHGLSLDVPGGVASAPAGPDGDGAAGTEPDGADGAKRVREDGAPAAGAQARQ